MTCYISMYIIAIICRIIELFLRNTTDNGYFSTITQKEDKTGLGNVYFYLLIIYVDKEIINNVIDCKHKIIENYVNMEKRILSAQLHVSFIRNQIQGSANTDCS